MKSKPLQLIARFFKAFTPGGNPIQNKDGIPIQVSANGTTSIADKDLMRYLEAAMNKGRNPGEEAPGSQEIHHEGIQKMTFIEKLKRKLIPVELRDSAFLDQKATAFAQNVATAEGVADPAERLLAALTAKKHIEDYADHIGYRLAYRADNADGLIYGTSAIGGVVAGGIVASVVNPVVGGCVLFAGIIIGMGNTVTGLSKKALQGYFNRAFEGHLDQVEGLHTKVAEMAKATLEENTVAIAASPKFGELYDNFPDIRDHFIKSFNQAAAKGELPVAKPAPAPNTDRKGSLNL